MIDIQRIIDDAVAGVATDFELGEEFDDGNLRKVIGRISTAIVTELTTNGEITVNLQNTSVSTDGTSGNVNNGTSKGSIS